LREPPAVVSALENPDWLRQFEGRTHRSGWGSDDLRELPPEAHSSGRAVADAIRSLLVLLAISERAPPSGPVKPHH
jgi:hypothetical protein